MAADGPSPAEWVPLVEHLRAIRSEDRRFADERDRRYAEVSAEREKALKIKEQADRDALELARQIQTYKDEQHNGLLGQIARERADMATRSDLKTLDDKFIALLKPVIEYVANQTGRDTGSTNYRTERRLDSGAITAYVVAAMVIVGTVVAVVIALAGR